MADALQDLSISEEDLDTSTNGSKKKDSVVGMNETEIEQHLQLCIKLSAENKITSKNAFGLHLIGLLDRVVKSKKSDLQFASLSLQASSKIYSGRVDALYRETFQFHNQLQTIVSGGKKRTDGQSDGQDADGEYAEGEAPTGGKGKQKKKFKSYVTTEDSITLAPQTDNVILKPHGNFELIKSTFSGSTAKKLISCLPLGSDFCSISVSRSPKIFKQKHPTNVTKYSLIKAEKALLEKMTKMSLPIAPELEGVMLSQPVDSPGNMLHDPDKIPGDLEGSFLGDLGPQSPGSPSDMGVNSPLAECLDFDVNTPEKAATGNNSIVTGNAETSHTPIFHGDVNILTEQFCALDITANIFVDEIANAVAFGGKAINPNLLPPQSVLKKMIAAAEKSALRKIIPTEKKKKEKKPRESFFKNRTVEDSLFTESKKITLSEGAISNWNVAQTTELATGFDKFNSSLSNNSIDSASEEREKEIVDEEDLEIPYKIMASMDPQFALKHYFFKRKEVWQLLREMNPSTPTSATVCRSASSNLFLRRTEDNMSLPEAEVLAQSFRRLSLHDSFEDHIGGQENMSVRSDDEHDMCFDFADEIQQMLVTPPELVKPLNVRPQQRAMNIDTDKVKRNLWSLIFAHLEQGDSVLFSDVCNELQMATPNKEGEDKISWQFAFVMLLVLANEKVLLLENVDDGSDLIIKKDISEIDSSDI